MSILRAMRKTILSNCYLIFGILIGIIISQGLNKFDCNKLLQHTKVNLIFEVNQRNVTTSVSFTPQIKQSEVKVIKKVSEAKKSEKRVIRPRYYSTELGIREKLFLGVLTTEEHVNTQAVYVNQTVSHLAEQTKFFIAVRGKPKVKYNLTNIVGFTDTRPKYRPFQVVKYLSDNFIQEYDYFYIMFDHNFLNIRQLKDIVNKISVSKDVYLGQTAKESSFCDLSAGVLLSNSVIAAMKNNLEWCVKNAISDDYSENLGRCVHYSTGLECQEELQNQSLNSYKLRHFDLRKHMERLSKLDKFNNAVNVYPVLQEQDFYLLNAYFTRLRLEKLNAKINELAKDLTGSWPPGEKLPVRPATRFDLPQQLYFNMSHMFFPNDFTNLRPHKTADFQDIQKIVSAIIDKVSHDYPDMYLFRRLVNGYRTFDWSRGMDYIIDMGFRDLTTGREIIKRFEVCKPLGRVEFIPVPYVTESSRVIILLPVQENEVELARNFIDNYVKVFMEQKEKVLLTLVLIYQYETPNKGDEDVFGDLKTKAQKLTNKYRSEDSKIIWVSIRLPKSNEHLTLENHKVLNFAVIDLSLKKIGADSLMLVLDVFTDPGITFINRVRMNTILNFQVFSPIPFRQYDPKVTKVEMLDVNKNVGHFDREEYKYISFYGRDYINMRKKIQSEIPIVKTDNDIQKLLQIADRKAGIFGSFIKTSKDLHAMRATEIALKIKYHPEKTNSGKNLFLGSKIQLAKIILNSEESLGLNF